MRSEPRRDPGGPLLAILLPGLPQLLGGRWAAGGFVLSIWVGLLGVLAGTATRLDEALAGPWDARLAVLALAGGLVASLAWSLGDLLRRERGPEGEAAWTPLEGLVGSPGTVLGLWVVAWILLVTLLAPLVSPYDPAFQGSLVTERLLPPSGAHPLGTDHLGRDVLSRLLYGARISLGIGVAAVAVAVTLGTGLGAVAGYVGGWVDGVVMRLVDLVLAFPRLVLIIAVLAFFDPSALLVTVVLGLTLWPATARLVRGEVLGLREEDFVVAARALGFGTGRILLRHVLPNALAPVIVAAALGIGDVIILESGLSFLGLGVQPPTPSWGSMISDGRAHLLGAWWLSAFPGAAVVLTVLAFNLVGDGLRDLLDPRLRGGRQ